VLGVYSMAPWNSVGMASIDPNAVWIWSTAGAASDAITGTVTLSRSLYLPQCHTCLSAGQAAIKIYMVVDNRATVYVNGALLINNQVSSVWNVGTPTPAVLYPGLNSLRFQATNDGGPAGLLLTITCAATGSVLLRGDSSWCSAGAGCVTQTDPPVQGASCAKCIAGTYGSTSRASSCAPCSAGMYSNSAGATACQACTNGKYSPIAGASTCQPCAEGQFSKAAGSTSCSQCTLCMAGAAILGTPCLQGSTADTVICACVSGYYGNGIGNQGCTLCPAFTITSGNSGGTSLLDCKCSPGYQCSYTKTIHVTIHIPNMSVANFEANYRGIFLAAVANAANVSVSKVSISSVILSGRRELSQEYAIAKFQVLESESVRTDLLLDTIKAHMPLQIVWQHAHNLNVRRVLHQDSFGV
jgi:hypothetical protein